METTAIQVGHGKAIVLAGAALAAIAVVLIGYGQKHSLAEFFGGQPVPPRDSPAAAIIERPIEIPPPLPGGDSSVSETPHALLLIGTQVGARPKESLAFLGVDRRNPQTYGVGALLANRARITAIAADHIVLERDGKSLRLDIGRASTLAKLDQPVRSGALDAVGGPPPRMSALEPSTESVIEVIRPSPSFDDVGRFTGYRLQPGTNAAAFARLGLAPGDRLVSVDGMALTDVAQAAQALQSLASGSDLAVTGGRTYSGHALDQMQNRGLMPSVVENTIRTGTRSADPIVGRTRFYDSVNNVTVITEGDRVVTAIPGRL